MELVLSDEQRMLRAMFADFAAGEVAPHAAQIDETEALPPALLDKLAAQGFLAALVPEEWGGAGLDTTSYCLLLEELGKADLATALTVDVHNVLAIRPLLLHGTPVQKDRFLEPMALGDVIGAFALSEPGAGSDLASMSARAERQNGSYLLSGSKQWVSNGPLAGLFLVFARTARGITAFLVTRDTSGLHIGYREKTLGLRGLACSMLYLDSCPVPEDRVLGQEGQGIGIARQALDYDRLALSALALGAAQRALDEGLRFSLEHEQFGGPIALKQAIQNYVADTATEVAALRCLVFCAARTADQGLPFEQEASMAKLFAAQVAMRAADHMLQVHGGYGYMREFAIQRLYRDCRALEIICGASQIQRYLIAQRLYQKRGLRIKP